MPLTTKTSTSSTKEDIVTSFEQLERELEIEDALMRHKDLYMQKIHGVTVYYVEKGYYRQQVNINDYLENRHD